jgi:hypothetical protein
MNRQNRIVMGIYFILAILIVAGLATNHHPNTQAAESNYAHSEILLPPGQKLIQVTALPPGSVGSKTVYRWALTRKMLPNEKAEVYNLMYLDNTKEYVTIQEQTPILESP